MRPKSWSEIDGPIVEMGDLLDHVFDCPDDFLIGEVDAPALPRHDAGAAGESVQRMIEL
jgi:hypothetical protein